jgi:hypothetical protein
MLSRVEQWGSCGGHVGGGCHSNGVDHGPPIALHCALSGHICVARVLHLSASANLWPSQAVVLGTPGQKLLPQIWTAAAVCTGHRQLVHSTVLALTARRLFIDLTNLFIDACCEVSTAGQLAEFPLSACFRMNGKEFATLKWFPLSKQQHVAHHILLGCTEAIPIMDWHVLSLAGALERCCRRGARRFLQGGISHGVQGACWEGGWWQQCTCAASGLRGVQPAL